MPVTLFARLEVFNFGETSEFLFTMPLESTTENGEIVTTYSVVIRFFTESLRLPQFPPWMNTDVRV